MTEEGPRRPVFVFLDAGVPDITRELEEWRRCIRNEEIFSVPFPKSFRSTSTPDYRVALFLQEEIFSAEGQIRNFLFSHFLPTFIFFTSDSKFIEDARDEFKSHPALQGGIRFHAQLNFISFVVPGFEQVFMKIIYINNDLCEKRPALVVKMFDALKQYLDQH